MFPGVVVLLTIFIAFHSDALQEPDPAARGKAVLERIVAGEFTKVEEQFTPEMKAALAPGRLAAEWAAEGPTTGGAAAAGGGLVAAVGAAPAARSSSSCWAMTWSCWLTSRSIRVAS